MTDLNAAERPHKFTTGDKLVLLRDDGTDIEYTIGQFYFTVGEFAAWMAFVDMTCPNGITTPHPIEHIHEGLVRSYICPPRSVAFCREVLEFRKAMKQEQIQ